MGMRMLLLGVAAALREELGAELDTQLLSVVAGEGGRHPVHFGLGFPHLVATGTGFGAGFRLATQLGESRSQEKDVDQEIQARIQARKDVHQPGLFQRTNSLRARPRLPLSYSVECCCKVPYDDELLGPLSDMAGACDSSGTGPFHLPPVAHAGSTPTCCRMHGKSFSTGMFGCGGNFNNGRSADIMQCVNPADMEAAKPVAPEVFESIDVDERELEAAYLIEKLAQGVSTAREGLIKEKAATYVDNVLAKYHVHNNESAGRNSAAGVHMDEVTAKTRDALLADVADSEKGVAEREPLLRRVFEAAAVFPDVVHVQRGTIGGILNTPVHFFVGGRDKPVPRDKPARAASRADALKDMAQLHPDWRERLDEVSLYSPLIDAAESCVDTMTEHHERMNHFKIETMMVDEAQIRIYEAESLWSPAEREEKKRLAAASGDKDFQLLIQIEEAQSMLYQATVEVTDLALDLERRFYAAYAQAYWKDFPINAYYGAPMEYSEATYSESDMRSYVRAVLDERGVAWSHRLYALSKSIKVLRKDYEGDMRREAAAAAESDAKRTWPTRTSGGDWEADTSEWL